MRLIGEVRADRPLLVVALPEEAAHLDGRLPVLLTGMGKLNAGLALASVLAGPVRPSEVVNLGTAGALREGLTGTHRVAAVIQHDLDDVMLTALTGHASAPPLTLAPLEANGAGPGAVAGAAAGPVLASGDRFVSDEADRAQLALRADLVDMEGYAVAAAAQRAGVPVRLVKHVSDAAGDGADLTWQDSVDACARLLAAWARDELG